MEFGFEYYDWLRKLNEFPVALILISIFGSFALVVLLGITRRLLKRIGLKAGADWTFLDYFMIAVGFTGFFGGFLLLVLYFLSPDDENIGIRMLLILSVLFICVVTFLISNKIMLKKLYHDMLSRTNEK